MQLTAAARRAHIDAQRQNPQEAEPEPTEVHRVSNELRHCVLQLKIHSKMTITDQIRIKYDV